jgi:hypothetical protein
MKNRHLNSFLSCLLILVPLLFTKSATADVNPQRISLAISGGASMGAYEAGLIWGLIGVIRQVEKSEDWSLGGELRPIEIASFAGASAGGINSLLAALAWAANPEKEGGFPNRIDDNIFRDVWLSIDVNQLLPSEPESSQYLPDDALLSRKELLTVSRELRKKFHRPGTFRPGLKLPVGFTVTRVRPETMVIEGVDVNNQRFYIPFEIRTQADGRVKFSFNPKDYPTLTDPAMILMPRSADSAPFSISDQQIEDALIITSAFPIGFGRRRLEYCRQLGLSSQSGNTTSSTISSNTTGDELICPEGYELAEAVFADGGLFDNLPIGLARKLSETNRLHKKRLMPVRYIYLDPNRQRYKTRVSEDKTACEGENPPEACRELTFNLASEIVVLGGAIGTARTYELFRELTGDKWRLNLSQLSRKIADIIDANNIDVNCRTVLPYFDGQPKCSDRLRHVARLLELAHSYQVAPIITPVSAQALMRARIAKKCRPSSTGGEQGFNAECTLDAAELRKQLANALSQLTAKAVPEKKNLRNDIQRSALSVDSDRLISVASRGGPITASLLSSFGAFIDYKFREFDYYVGTYDAVAIITHSQCSRNFPAQDQQAELLTCRDELSQELYRHIGVADNPKSRYLFALMAKREFGGEGGLRFAYEPMPPEDRDIRIIFEGLDRTVLAKDDDATDEMLSTEREFFEYLKTEKFEPTPPPEGGKSLLTLIMDDPEYWTNEMLNRVTERLVYLEKQTEGIYRAREPDPEKRDKANTALMGAGALAIRTAAYKYPRFSFAPSTAPSDWFWRNIIPYEVAFDFVDGDVQVFWQPTMSLKYFNAGLRIGFGFTGGVFTSAENKERDNYGTVGLDLTRVVPLAIFSGWGITPAVYHQWKESAGFEQTTFGLDAHVYLLNNRLRISFGARDIIDNASDTLMLTFGVADLPGLVYWLSR